MTDQALLTARGLVKRWGTETALDGVDLDVRAGEVVAIVGPSGSGKSTLLRCLNGLERPDAGEVQLEGRRLVSGAPDVDQLRARVGMVFQAFHLFPHLSVLENLCLAPMRVSGVDRRTAEADALRLLERVGLGAKRDQWPDALSGGQRQRVAIARALAMRPAAVLFDEPTSALDPETVGEVLAVLRDLADDGLTMVVVTHEMTFARDVADRALFLDEGRIVEQGPANELFIAPRTARLRDFLARLRRST